MIEIFDISLTVREGMAAWPGLLAPRLDGAERMARGDAVNVTDCHFCAHTGTHIDAPFHHLASGAAVDQLRWDGLLGRADVVDCTQAGAGITAAELDRAAPSGPILLLKTGNSQTRRTLDFWDARYVCLEPDAAEWIRSRGFRGVGIDSLGIERFGSPSGAAHKILLEAGIVILEGLDLRGIEPGAYWLACLPLKLHGADGAPARALLIRDTTGAFLNAWQQAERRYR
jgi:arylformamidase